MAQALVLSDISQIRHTYHFAQNWTYIYTFFKKSKQKAFLVFGAPFLQKLQIKVLAQTV
jgi:hypothetical protein